MMNIGDYVRLNNCVYNVIVINRIAEIFEDTILTENDGSMYQGEYTKEEIIKSSPNIIDLIEVGDLMYIDISPDDCDGIVVPRIAETERELKQFTRDIEIGSCILKGIVTKEQIEKWSIRLVSNNGIMDKKSR